ncbi:permease of the drug/metabolite transporter (DMT) superfamily [Geminocystis sp. NIES-3708]|uniref:DMT family transporter n=1 Tax=Geminocystis sp. NIES-3708 TaxID=1615909 RepID=UPI0005FC3EF0|nr:DMT family transporter [Geminocystis sp. NIES-3708]BAQ62066.1 permease of the drug/metabolite transporter (DMT) superfamily [Geminocystis sp. NIES-3708]
MQFKFNHNSFFLTPIILITPFFLWGTAMVAMKGVIHQTTPLFMAGIRIFPAGILVLLVAMILGKYKPITPLGWLWIGLFSLVDGLMFQGFLGEGLLRTGAGLGSVMIDSQPLAVAILSRWLFKEIIGFWGWLGLIIGIIGISLIGLPDELIINWWQGNFIDLEFSWQGLFDNGQWLMLLASLSMAIGTVMIPYISRHVDPVVATGWHLVIGGFVLFLLSFQFETSQWVNLDFSAWLSIAYATIFGSAIAYGLFFFLASKGNLTSLSALTFLTPIFALTFGNLLLKETLSDLQWQGVCLTLVSIYLINQREQINNFFAQEKFTLYIDKIKLKLLINRD